MIVSKTKDASLLCFKKSQEPLEELHRIGRAATDMEIDSHNAGHSADDGVAISKDATVDSAVPDRNDPLRIGCRIVGTLQRLAHVFGDRTCHQKDIGVSR